MMFAVAEHYQGDQEDDMGETHNAYKDGGDQQNVLVEKPNGRNQFGDQCVRQVSKKYGVKVQSVFLVEDIPSCY